jgi:hypothetical protein
LFIDIGPRTRPFAKGARKDVVCATEKRIVVGERHSTETKVSRQTTTLPFMGDDKLVIPESAIPFTLSSTLYNLIHYSYLRRPRSLGH